MWTRAAPASAGSRPAGGPDRAGTRNHSLEAGRLPRDPETAPEIHARRLRDRARWPGRTPDERPAVDPRGPARHVVLFEILEQPDADLGVRGDRVQRDAPPLALHAQAG